MGKKVVAKCQGISFQQGDGGMFRMWSKGRNETGAAYRIYVQHI